MKKIFLCLSVFLYMPFSVLADINEHVSPNSMRNAISEVNRHYPALPAEWVEKMVNNASFVPSVVRLINNSAESKLNWEKYRSIFMTKERIKVGQKFHQKYGDIIKSSEKKYNVPAYIILGILGVETYFGRILGKTSVRDALVTLSTHDLSKRKRFFNAQLADFLLLVHRKKLDPTIKGSYAGAMGMGQFIPTSIRRWGVDGDNDGVIDLVSSKKDAIFSIANYLKEHGWKEGVGVATKSKQKQDSSLRFELNEGEEWWMPDANFKVLKTYNNSNLYALAVYSLGKAIVE